MKSRQRSCGIYIERNWPELYRTRYLIYAKFINVLKPSSIKSIPFSYIDTSFFLIIQCLHALKSILKSIQTFFWTNTAFITIINLQRPSWIKKTTSISVNHSQLQLIPTQQYHHLYEPMRNVLWQGKRELSQGVCERITKKFHLRIASVTITYWTGVRNRNPSLLEYAVVFKKTTLHTIDIIPLTTSSIPYNPNCK